ncbi:hypothetical protein HMPREF9343_02628 [Cutibacterium acnes HL099PA1]|nr:hypothetical protein HMPREF9566_00630 [Cutibacterium acnes HL045PA1]EGF73245.1 hypothetical protein HMPREF9343_02628 [Cutibacterium acnes HL099PA1]
MHCSSSTTLTVTGPKARSITIRIDEVEAGSSASRTADPDRRHRPYRLFTICHRRLLP